MKINLTSEAKQELERLLAKRNSTGKPMRLYIAGIG